LTTEHRTQNDHPASIRINGVGSVSDSSEDRRLVGIVMRPYARARGCQ
jgi:hypothetical protein